MLVKAFPDAVGILRPLPYLLVALGCGVFGNGAGALIERAAMKNHPREQKQAEIERNDERNITITIRAKAKAYDMMVTVFGAVLLCLALMNTDLTVILLLVFAYLFVVGCSISYRVRYNKEM